MKEPYAPVSDAVTTAVDAIAAAEAADAIATAEADAVAAGLVSRMTKNRRAVPDVFASGADSDEEVADGSESAGVPPRKHFRPRLRPRPGALRAMCRRTGAPCCGCSRP